MPSTWPDILLAVLAGPLAIAGAAKLANRADGAGGWPVREGPLAPPLGPRLVGGVELIAACILTLVPGRTAAAVAIGAYGTLTLAARLLRDERCACFGAARLATVGRTHVTANAAGACVACVACVGGPGDASVPRACLAAVSAAVTLGLILAVERLPAERLAVGRGRRRRPQAAGCEEQVSTVRIYTTLDCPSCQALKKVMASMEPVRRAAVFTVVLGQGEEPPEAVRDLGVPAAYGVNAAGEQVCAVVSGIGAVKALIDSVTLRPGGPGGPVETVRGR